MSTSFVDYYSKNNISPVNQDISNLRKHFNRRANLLKALGFPPTFIKDKAIIEFGPGSGDNSIYNASLNPQTYVLVDGNKTGLDKTKNKLSKFKNINIETHLCLFEDFKSDKLFDLVWAEGCIPHQKYPCKVANLLSKFVKPEGGYIVTCASGTSYLSEIVRKVVYLKSVHKKRLSIEEKLRYIRPFMSSHLQTLQNMSRFVDDWILDNIIHPFADAELFSIPMAIHALNDGFDIYYTSPIFLEDWRWYKDIYESTTGMNELSIDAYFKNNINFLDKRLSGVQHSREFGEKLEKSCMVAWKTMQEIELGNIKAFYKFKETLLTISNLIKNISPVTSDSILLSLEYCEDINFNNYDAIFANWWGRGQQYASFLKRKD